MCTISVRRTPELARPLIIAVALVATVFSSSALAQQRARRDTVGVGLHDCARVIQAGLSSPRASSDQSDAEAEYVSWFYGWLTGFAVGSGDGGLGGIDITDGQTWALLVTGSCRDSETTYADAVRRLAAEEILKHRSRDLQFRVAGFGRSDCSQVTASDRDAPRAYAGGYREWAYGYVSGYNALRADVGLEPLHISDETAMYASIEAHCRGNPVVDLNTAVAVWVLDAEAQQKASPIPPDAKPTNTGLTADSLRAAARNRNRPLAGEPIAGVGAWACERVTAQIADESSGVSRAVNEAYALGWFTGYLSAGDAIRALKGRPSVDWGEVDSGTMWAKAKNACRQTPSATFASIAAQREAALVLETPDRTGAREVSNVGAGTRPCTYFLPNATTDASRAETLPVAAERLLAESQLIGWAEGYFSALNLHRRDIGGEPLDLTDIGRKARESVEGFCRDSDPIGRVMVRFGSRNYPGLFADLR